MIYENNVRLLFSSNRRPAVGLSRWLSIAIGWIIGITFCVNVGLLEAQSTVVARDNFDRPDGPIGTNWSYPIASQGTFNVTNDTVTSVPVNEHVEAYWSSNSFSANQYSQASLSSVGPFTGVILRGDGNMDPIYTNPPAGSQFYMGFVFAPNDYRIYHWINNAFYPEIYGTTETWQTNDILRLEISGSVEPLITMYRNGKPVLLWLITDSGDVKTNGSPGLCMYSRDTDPLTIDNWEGGNLDPDTNTPTVPTNLTATAVAPNQINLNWTSATDNVEVVGYLVERSQGAGSTNFILLDTSTGTNYSDANSITRYVGMYPYTPGAASLSPGTTYNYRLRATDAAGNFSGYSAVVTATTPIPPLPTISAIPDQTTLAGISVGPFPFYITDPGVNPASLTATATSSNTNLVPDENVFIFNVSGNTQALTITPADGQTGTSTITITASNGVNSTNISFLLTVNPPGNGTDAFANPTNIVIPSNGTAAPYPSTINVSGETGTITNVLVTLHGMSHSHPGNVNVLLVGPGGQAVVLMSDTVGGNPMADLTFTLSDQAYYPLPQSSPLLDGTFLPTDDAPNHTNPPWAFPAPAPAPPFSTILGTFDGLSPNGTWSLYVYDGGTDNGGQISGGWSLAITTVSPPTISGLTNQSTPVNTPTVAIPFEINDAQTPASNLVLTATSSDTTVVAVSGITLTNSDNSFTNQTITLTPQPNVIGTTTISVIVTDGDGMSATNSFLMTVNPGQLTVTGITASNKPYDGTTNATLNVSSASLIGQGLSGSDVTLDTSGVSGTFSNKDVGTNKTVQIAGLFLNGTDAGNYVLTQPTTTANITAVGVTISSGLSANNKAYDGTTGATITSNNVVLAGVLAGDVGNVRLSTNGYVANFSNAGVGTNVAVTVSGLSLTGSAAGNYSLGQPTNLTANITAVGVSVTSGLSANNKAYDGTTAATITSNNVVLAGVLAGDAGNVRLSTNGYVANFSGEGVGTNIAVTVSGLSLTGSAAGNYSLGQPTNLTANITAVGVTISSGLTANNKAYDGTTTATITSNSVVLAGVLAGDAGNVRLRTNGYVANFSGAGVGTNIAVTVSGLSLTGSAAGNYSLGQPTNLTANITALGVSVTSGLSANNKAYDGTTAATITSNNVVLAGVLAGDAGNVRLSTNGYVANFSGAGVGTNVAVTVSGLSLTGSAAGNYSLGQPTNLTANITAVGVSVTSGLSANNKAYDGTTAATITSNNVVLAGVLAGDVGNVRLSTNGYVANFSGAGVGTNVAVTVSGLSLTGSAAGNYSLGQPTNLTANITAVGVSVTSGLSANNKAYDGTTTATITSNNVVLSGVLAGDVGNVRLSTNGYVANFSGAGVGTNVAVTVSGLSLTGSAAGNYSLGQPTNLTANITALGVSVTSGLSANNKAYDGTTAATITSNSVVLAGVLAGDAGNVRISTNGYVANFSGAGVGTNIAVTVSGLSLTGSAAGNYSLGQPTNLTANITAVGVSVTSGLSANNKAYDGTTAATITSNNVVLAGVLAGDVGNVRLSTNGYVANFSGANVGTNIAVTVSGLSLTGSAAGNYSLGQPTNLTANITAVGVSVTSGLSANNKAYDGTTTATLSSNNLVLAGVLAGDVGNVRLSTNGYVANFSSVGVGTNIAVTVSGLSLTGSAAGNYSLGQPTNLTANITAVGVSVTSGLSANNKAYDGTTAATITSNNVVLAGVLAGDVGNVRLRTNGYVANFSGANVGTNIAVTVSGLSLTGSAAGNYSLGQPTNLTANITAVGVTISSGLSANNKAYDGTTTATLSSNNVVLASVLAGDVGNVWLSTNGYVANFSGAVVGTNITVTVSGLSLTGSAAGNYSLGQPTNLTANITAVGVTISSGLSANNKAYDGTTTATITSNNVVLAGVLAGDTANVRLSTNGYVANFSGAGVGTNIAVTVSGLSLTGSAAGNYSLGQPTNLTANITAVGVSVTSGLSGNNKAYDGTTGATITSNNVVLAGVLAGDVGNVRLSTNGYVANFSGAGVGTNIAVTVSGLSLTGSAAGNYSLGQPTNLTANITAVGVSVTSGLSANNKAYDGTTAATITSNSVVLAGVLAGDVGNVRLSTNGYVANFSSANVGTNIAVTVSGLSLTGSAAGNYSLGQPTNLTANITAVGVTISSGLSANNKAYDGTTAATLSSNSVVLAGVLAGDVGNVRLRTNGYVANFSGANVGTNIAVTVSGLSLTGSAAGNYSLGQPTNLTANITAVGVTISSGLTANNKAYDGTTTATITSNNVVLAGVLAGDTANVRLSTNGYVANFSGAGVGTNIAVTVSGLSLTGSAAGNYSLGQPTNLTANITAVGVSVTSGLSANSKAYDGTTAATITSNNVVLAGVLAGDAGNVRLSTNGYVANFSSANVGTNIAVTVSGLSLTGSAAGNYSLGQPTNLTANITAVGVTISSGLTANNKAYDGTTTATITSNSVVLAGVLAGDVGNVRLSTNGYVANFSGEGVGTNIAVTVSGLSLTGSAAGNYSLGQPTNLTANITAVGVTISSGLTANNKAYDGTTTATITSNSVVLAGVLAGDAGNVRLRTNGYVANFSGAGVGTNIAVTVSGLSLTGSAAGNYSLGQPTNLTANITALGVSVTSGLSANNKAYDGTTAATITSNNVVLAGVLAGDAGNVRLSTNGYVANFSGAGVGTNVAVTVSGLSLTGSAAGNYSLGQPTNLTANITAVGVSVTSGLSANNKAYDGTTAATITSNNVVLAGVLAGDVGNVRLSTNGYVANFSGAGVGTNVAVTVSGLSLTGSAAGNYSLGQPTNLTANITAVGVSVTSGLSANNKAYDGTTTATITSNNVVLSGVLAGDVGNVRLSTNGYVANFSGAGVGTNVAVTVSGLSLTGSAAGNYSLGQPTNLTANITALGVSVTSGLSANNKAYDGTTAATITSNSVVLAGVLAGDAGNVRISTNGYVANFSGAGVGTNIAVTVSGLSLTGSAAGNYSLGQPTNLTANITAVGVSVTSGLSANNKAYDGTTTATITSNNVVLSGVLAGDVGNVRLSTNGYVANFSGAGVGTNVAVTVSGLSLTGSAAGNYSLGQPTNLTANITALGVSVTSGLSANSKAYDGTTAATITSNSVVLAGVLAGDAGNVRISTNGYVANFSGAGVGTNIAVTVSGLSLTGSAAGNYSLGQPTNLTANITAVGVSVTSGLSASNKAYDGTTAATITSNNVVLAGVLAGDVGNVRLRTNGYVANFSDANVGTNIAVTVSGLSLTGSAAGNYSLGQPTNLTANITAVGVTISSGLSANSKPYDGTTTATITSNNVVLAGVLAGDVGNVRLSTNGYNANFASAGVGTAIPVTVSGLSLTGSAAGNYSLSQPTNLTANIIPKALTIASAVPPPVITSIQLTNGVITMTWNSVSGGIYRVQYNNSLNGGGWTDLSPDVTATGSTATQTNTVGSATQRFYRVKLLNSGLSANDKPYDGTTAATLSSNAVVLVGVLPADTANVSLVTNGYVANFATANVGTGIPVTVSGLGLAGIAAGNYSLSQPTNLTANITGKVLTILSVPSPVITSIQLTNGVVTISWSSVTGGIYRVQYNNSLNGGGWTDLSPDVTAIGSTATQTNAVGSVSQRFYRIEVLNSGITANNKVYDGTTAATINSNNVVLVGVVSGDTVGLSTNGYAANFANSSVGTAIPVTVNGLTLTGASAAEYTLTPLVGLTANITPATLTVSAINQGKTYGLPIPPLTVSYSGFVNNEGMNVLAGAPSLSTSATINSSPGLYDITADVGTLSATNYIFSFVKGTLTVFALPQLSSTRLSGNQFSLAWPTIVDQNYQLETTTNLTAATWTLLVGPVPGTGNPIIVTNGFGASPQRFFRLSISP